MFVMLNDGGTPKDDDYDMATRVLIQRGFIFGLLTSGIAVTLLHGAEFRNSKVGQLRLMTAEFERMVPRCFLSCWRCDLVWRLVTQPHLLFGMPCKLVLSNSRAS